MLVSEKLITGILGADGLIWIDSSASNRSFWTAFERDLAARRNKKMFRFDPETRRIINYEAEARKLWVAHLYHESDSSDVRKIVRWLVSERSFEFFEDPEKLGKSSSPSFSSMDSEDRDMRLFSIRTFGAIYLLFLSQSLIQDEHLLTHVTEQTVEHPRSTMICWLDSPETVRGPAVLDILKQIPKDRTYIFRERPLAPHFNLNELDDLMVRLYWMIYQGRPGDWYR